MDTPTPKTPTLAELVELIEGRISINSYEELLSVLRILLQHVPEERRLELLSALPEARTPTAPEFSLGFYAPLPSTSVGSVLLEKAEGLVHRLENGHYFDGLRWDEERREERAWGDESWAIEMDELFGQAATNYLAGNHELAVRVMGRLLGTFRHADRTGVFCGPDAAAKMVQTDLSEAKRRYFRSLYAVSPPSDRPSRLLAQMEALRSIGEAEVGLRSMMDTDGDGDPPLEDVDLFLPAWVDLLRSVSVDHPGWGREVRRLLREGVEIHGGADGLGELAHRSGADHPEAYHDWVGALVRLDRLPEAIRAARDGVARIRDAAYRARLADRLGLLARRCSDGDLAVEATRAAWRASPTQVRLLQLVNAAETASVRETVLAREAFMILRPDWQHSDALACRLLLLVGRHEEAATRFQRADALGWGRSDHAGSVVLPFLLLASTALTEPPEGSAIQALWHDLDVQGTNYFDRRLLMDQLSGGSEMEQGEQRPYTELLRSAVQEYPIPEEYRARMLAIAQIKVEAVVRDILNAQHRRGQSQAAQLSAALGEAIALQSARADGLAFVKGIRDRYRRYSVFSEALKDVIRSSPILAASEDNDRPSLVLVKG